MNPVSDEAVMVEVRDGQVGRLAVLFERHHRGLFNYFCRQTGNRDLSEDLTQEVFMRILKYRRSYQPRSPFASWMFQIARHTRMDAVHRRKREVTWKDEGYEPAAGEPCAIETLHKEQEIGLVREALNSLPEDKREVLLLSRFHRLRYEEIGQILGCEVGAVKVRVYRAMKALSQAFAEKAGKTR